MPANQACPGSFTPTQLRVSIEAHGWDPDCPNFRPSVFQIPWDGQIGSGTFDGVTIGVEVLTPPTLLVTLVIDRGLCLGSNSSSSAGIAEIDAKNHTTFYGLDALGQQALITDQLGDTVTHDYL